MEILSFSFYVSPLPRTSTPTSYSGPRRRGQSLSLEGNEQDSHPFIIRIQTPPPILKSNGSRPLTPKCPLGTRPHTPVGRVDIRPNDDHLLPPQNMGYSPPSAQRATSLSSVTPTPEKRLLKVSPRMGVKLLMAEAPALTV